MPAEATSSDAQALNPQIKSVWIGKRVMQELVLYPLAVSDQLKMTDIIASVIQQLDELQQVEGEEALTEMAFARAILDAIKANIATALSLVADMTEKRASSLLEEMTNPQLSEVLNVIWEVNYEETIKNVKDLFGKVKSLFLSKRSSQTSLSDIPNTIPPTSTPEPGGMAD